MADILQTINCWPHERWIFCFGENLEFLARLMHFYTFSFILLDLNIFWLTLPFPITGIDKCVWWRHQMEAFSALLAICAGNLPVTGEFPTQRPVTRSLYVFFDLRLSQRLNKQTWGWWFETPSRPLWRHCNWVHSCQKRLDAGRWWANNWSDARLYKNDLFPLISTIILPKVLTPCYKYSLKKRSLWFFYMYVTLCTSQI